MAFHPLRLRRALSLSFSLLDRSIHGYKPQPFSFNSASRLLPPRTPAPELMRRPFTSTTALFRRGFNPETDEIGPDTILFEGCDYNHWLITVDFPRDANIPREQMIETYINIAAQVFGSVEEAKKKIYALSTTVYQGFQVECSEEISEKFKSIPQVVFVLPDSYIDPVNKEYGGDKYVNGEIFPRPPPVHYGRRNNRDMRPRDQNYGPPSQQNYDGPPRQQNYDGPPRRQNYGPPPQQPPRENTRQPPQQNYGAPPQPNAAFAPPQQNYGAPPQPNAAFAPPQQNAAFAPTQQQNYRPPPQQNYGAPPQQNVGFAPPQQNAGFAPPQQNAGFAPQQQHGYGPPPQQQNYKLTQPSYAPQQQHSYGSPPEQSYVPNPRGGYGNSPPRPNNGPAGLGERSGYSTSEHDERHAAPSYQGNFNRAGPGTNFAQEQGRHQRQAQPGQRGFSQDDGSFQDGAFGQVSGGYRNF